GAAHADAPSPAGVAARAAVVGVGLRVGAHTRADAPAAGAAGRDARPAHAAAAHAADIAAQAAVERIVHQVRAARVAVGLRGVVAEAPPVVAVLAGRARHPDAGAGHAAALHAHRQRVAGAGVAAALREARAAAARLARR